MKQYEHTSVVITTHLEFAQWPSMFVDAKMTTTLLDISQMASAAEDVRAACSLFIPVSLSWLSASTRTNARHHTTRANVPRFRRRSGCAARLVRQQRGDAAMSRGDMGVDGARRTFGVTASDRVQYCGTFIPHLVRLEFALARALGA